jgi:predicted NAD-dependent protein-ADP-ribosyltransferase YbiA (DUF1768 family)
MPQQSQSSLLPLTSWFSEHYFLNPSNNVFVDVDDVQYDNLRIGFEVTRTPDPELRKHVAKMSPYNALQWGLSYHPQNTEYEEKWHENKQIITHLLLRQTYGLTNSKAERRKKLENAVLLLETGNRPLIYENLHCDTYWGVCGCNVHSDINNPSQMDGHNILGQELERIREEVRNVFQEKVEDLDDCESCLLEKGFFVPPVGRTIYTVGSKIYCVPYCESHRDDALKLSREAADDREIFSYITREGKIIAMQTNLSQYDGEFGWTGERGYTTGVYTSTVKKDWGVMRIGPGKKVKEYKGV